MPAGWIRETATKSEWCCCFALHCCHLIVTPKTGALPHHCVFIYGVTTFGVGAALHCCKERLQYIPREIQMKGTYNQTKSHPWLLACSACSTHHRMQHTLRKHHSCRQCLVWSPNYSVHDCAEARRLWHPAHPHLHPHVPVRSNHCHGKEQDAAHQLTTQLQVPGIPTPTLNQP